MQLIYNEESFKKIDAPVVLTIGSFDGVHLGHQTLLRQIKSLAEREQRLSAVFTFVNHPSEILRSTNKTFLLCHFEHKIKLIQAMNIDVVVLQAFTHEFSLLSYDMFLRQLHQKLPFSHLILGYDAVLGRDRKGDRSKVSLIAKELNFEVEYLPPFTVNGRIVSSRDIRSSIQQGRLEEISTYLGRPFSVIGRVLPGRTRGRELGFPTANLDVQCLSLPPLGVYAVQVIYQGKAWAAVANLGTAPTLHSERPVLLEVHVMDGNFSLYGEEIEVIFVSYIRPEQRFATREELSNQIQKDIRICKEILQFPR